MHARRFLSTVSRSYPYFVPRNSNGNLPVYSDIRNGGTRLQVSIRNVDGSAPVRSFALSFAMLAS